MIEYIELLSVKFIVLVTRLVEDCETRTELVRLGMMVVNMDVLVNLGIVLVLKREVGIVISLVFVDDICVLDAILDIINDEWTAVDVFCVELGMDEIVWLVLVIECIEDDIGIEELAVINGCEVIIVCDTVFSEVELLKCVDIEWLFVVCVLSLVAKIKEKRPINIVISHYIHYTCYQSMHILVKHNIAMVLG